MVEVVTAVVVEAVATTVTLVVAVVVAAVVTTITIEVAEEVGVTTTTKEGVVVSSNSSRTGILTGGTGTSVISDNKVSSKGTSPGSLRKDLDGRPMRKEVSEPAILDPGFTLGGP